MTSEEFNQKHEKENENHYWLCKKHNKRYTLNEWFDFQPHPEFEYTCRLRKIGDFTSPIAAERFLQQQGKPDDPSDSKTSV